MVDVVSLLTLPKTSQAFSTLSTHPSGPSRVSSRSASPPRKIPRLDSSSDPRSASASSARSGAAEQSERGRTIVLRVVGHPVRATPESAYDEDYALLRRTISTLLTPDETDANAAVPLSATYDRIFRACRAVVAEAGKGEGIYDVVKMELERCVGKVQKVLIDDERKSTDWLVPFTNKCAWFEKQVGLLQSLLAYLDTLYVAEKTQQPRIEHLAYSIYTDSVIRSPRVTQAIMEGFADWLEWERTNTYVHLPVKSRSPSSLTICTRDRQEHALRPIVKQLVRHIYSFGLYDDVIESTYLNLTHAYYTKESNDLVANGVTAANFLNKHDERVKQESERAADVLLDRSFASVKDTAQGALVTGRLQWLAKDALKVFFETKQDTKLQSMYNTFSKVGGLKVLSAAFKAYVQQHVKEIVTDAEHDEDMVPRLLEFKSHADTIVHTVFVDRTSATAPSQPIASTSSAVPTTPVQPNRDFTYGLIDAFEAGFKSRRNKPAEMIAKHMDKALRRGQKGKQDEVFEAELERVLALYRFTDDMDVFRTFYQRALAKRLLLGRSASDDVEKAVLKKLKENYDPEFGMGDLMFKDLELSREMMANFLTNAEKEGDASRLHKLNVMVLQRSWWPFAARAKNVDLPAWMGQDLDAYRDFYRIKHQGHKLDWDHALGTATLKARFKNVEKELSVSLHQAVVLLLFNENDELSVAEIQAQTGLERAELERTLQSLALGRKHVLKKSTKEKEILETDTFRFNADFTDQRYQIHINSIQAKETPEETKRTQNSIEQDRKHALDAAIVRVMKGKKELTYEQLKTATIEAVKRHFVPEVTMIKKRIEGLVEQEYLRRDDEDKNRYFYVA
ncbi:Cullin-domain-containing protein [Fomes fomentarius]|nr:Cullin-domain-containing protein [Fomes fomentarius]